MKKSKKAEIKMCFGKPTIFIDDKPYSPFIYSLTDQPGGRWSTDDIPQLNIKQFYDIGVRIFQLDIALDHIWFEDGSFSLERAKKQIQGVTEVCPDASIIFRLHVNAPKWWIKQHPEENTKYDNADPKPDPIPANRQLIFNDAGLAERFSLASKKWLKESTDKVIQFCKEFSKTEESCDLIGIQVACGIYGEWHYWGFMNWEPDFSQPMRIHFIDWLKTKYKNDIKSLQSAWNKDIDNFDSITVPNTLERENTSAGIFRDPTKDKKVIDYYTCQHELIRENVLHFCKTIKENWDRPIITGSFYGYFFSVFNRLAAGSQLDLEPVLKSKYIDYLCGPQAYEPEAYLSGEPYRSRSLITSILLNGKLWLDEMDQQPRRILPFNERGENNEKYDYHFAENIALLTRNTMFPFSKGMGLWFYDFGPAAMYTHPEKSQFPNYCLTGFWDHPKYLECIKKLKNIYDDSLNKNYESDADVLLIYDTEVQFYLQSVGKGDPVTAQIIDWMSLNTFYSGVIFDPIHINDLDKIDFSKYKAIVFGNTFLIKDKTKEIINNKIKKDGRHLLWIYAPGFTNGKIVSDDFVINITDFNLKRNTISKNIIVKTNNSNNKKINYEFIPEIHIENISDEKIIIKPRGECNPLYFIEDIESKPYGYYLHDKTFGFGMKEFHNYTSWFIGLPPTDYRILKFIFEKAEAHIYSNEKDIFYGGNGILTMHSKIGGKKQIKLKNGKLIEANLPNNPVTVLLDNKTGEIIYIGG